MMAFRKVEIGDVSPLIIQIITQNINKNAENTNETVIIHCIWHKTATGK